MGGGNVRIPSLYSPALEGLILVTLADNQGAKSAQARARNAAKADKGPTSQLKSNAVRLLLCSAN